MKSPKLLKPYHKLFHSSTKGTIKEGIQNVKNIGELPREARDQFIMDMKNVKCPLDFSDVNITIPGEGMDRVNTIILEYLAQRWTGGTQE